MANILDTLTIDGTSLSNYELQSMHASSTISLPASTTLQAGASLTIPKKGVYALMAASWVKEGTSTGARLTGVGFRLPSGLHSLVTARQSNHYGVYMQSAAVLPFNESDVVTIMTCSSLACPADTWLTAVLLQCT